MISFVFYIFDDTVTIYLDYFSLLLHIHVLINKMNMSKIHYSRSEVPTNVAEKP